MTRKTRRSRFAATAAAAAVAVVTTGCSPGLFGAPRPAAAGGQIRMTEHVTPSALVAVTAAGPQNATLLQVIGATARPLEHLDIASADGTHALVASSSPAPAVVRIPARPTPPARGATSYQEAVYHKAQVRWDGQYAAGQRAVASRTAAGTDTWVRNQLARAGSGSGQGSLGAECEVASNVLAGLADQAGARFGGRVVLMAAGRLGDIPPDCQLAGADVIVMTPFLPTAADAAAAQEKVIAAGAARASVLGPESTSAELGHLVSDGLGRREVSEPLSGPALFGNDSAVLRPAAAAVLTPLLPQLRQPGAIAVINGYASAPGDARHNQQLSENRAAAVAAFFEARGISAAALLVVGHGATSFVAPGASPDNRRVVVVVEEPA
jgi:outer membrane protein OmpA-like peptidoglycan-associated protein